MCTTCGCDTPAHHEHHGDTVIHRHEHHEEVVREGKLVAVEVDVLAKNNSLAQGNRRRFVSESVFVLNLVSSPGSGKTTLLERTLTDLRGAIRCAVIEGDQQTDNDAVRIAATGAPVRQINTGSGCHLDAHMVGHAAEELPLPDIDILFIENVGNLVCPTDFDLGEHAKVMILSVPEGHDKPYKYPSIFQVSEAVILNKYDTLGVFDFDEAEFRSVVARLNPHAPIFPMAATKGDGVAEWAEWLAGRIEAAKGSA